MKKASKIEDFKISSEYVTFRIGRRIFHFMLSEISPRLAEASDEERNSFTFSPSGYGIHWDGIDEDLSVEGLIHVK